MYQAGVAVGAEPDLRSAASKPGCCLLYEVQAKRGLSIPAPDELTEFLDGAITLDGCLKLSEIRFLSSPENRTSQSFSPVTNTKCAPVRAPVRHIKVKSARIPVFVCVVHGLFVYQRLQSVFKKKLPFDASSLRGLEL